MFLLKPNGWGGRGTAGASFTMSTLRRTLISHTYAPETTYRDNLKIVDRRDSKCEPRERSELLLLPLVFNSFQSMVFVAILNKNAPVRHANKFLRLRNCVRHIEGNFF